MMPTRDEETLRKKPAGGERGVRGGEQEEEDLGTGSERGGQEGGRQQADVQPQGLWMKGGGYQESFQGQTPQRPRKKGQGVD